jgi:hypothetical protein
MFSIRSSALSILCLVLSATVVHAQDLSEYRGFRLGMTLAAAAQQARVPVAAARVLYQRPQLIQELEWQPQAQAGEAEAVKNARFTFYEGRLYKIAVAYDRNRIEGLTTQDFVEAISASYGPPILASTQVGVAVPAAYIDYNLGTELTVAAQWEDSEHSVRLVQSRYPSTFGLVLLTTHEDRLAREAAATSARLDTIEAPQREATRLQEVADQDRARAVKARSANKPAFRF